MRATVIQRLAARGFTLLELMIVVAVIALLVAVALPSYQEQIRKSKRAEAKAALLKAAQFEERFYTSWGEGGQAKYSSDLGLLFGIGTGTQVRSGEDPRQGSYDLRIDPDPVSNRYEDGFKLTATPRGAGIFDDPVCGPLMLDNVGNRTFGPSPNGKGTKDTCW
jgi:type IV pilus assembly protein PilE